MTRDSEHLRENRRGRMPFWLGLSATILLGSACQNPADEQGQKGAGATATASAADLPVVAMVSRQSADGLTEAQMDQEFLSDAEHWSLERMRVHIAKAMRSRGEPFEPQDLSAESVFVEAGGKKVAVTRFKAAGATLVAQIVGIVGDELVRVVCFTEEPDIVITRGPCNEKIKESLGVSMDPRD